MLTVNIDISEVEKEIDRLQRKFPKQWEKESAAAFGRIAEKARDNAKNLCPISPKKSQYIRELKSGRTTREQSSFNPGVLTNSIRASSNKNQASVFIDGSSRAAGYAVKMHDKRGILWRNLGPGSRDKNKKHPGVGEKFIERGIKESNREILDAWYAAIDNMKKWIQRQG